MIEYYHMHPSSVRPSALTCKTLLLLHCLLEYLPRWVGVVQERRLQGKWLCITIVFLENLVLLGESPGILFQMTSFFTLIFENGDTSTRHITFAVRKYSQVWTRRPEEPKCRALKVTPTPTGSTWHQADKCNFQKILRQKKVVDRKER